MEGSAHLNLGLIGNCQYNALVAPSGAVEWLCWPRFDASFVFGGLLDRKKGGVFQIAPAHGGDGVQSYLENTNVLVTRFKTPSGSFEVVDFAPRYRQHERFDKPKMLIRIARPLDGSPLVSARCAPVYDYGETPLRADVRSNHIHFEGAPQPLRLHSNTSLHMLAEGRPFILNEPTYFVLTWGLPLDRDLRETCETLLEKTIAYWQRWVKHCHLPRRHQRAVIRSALALKLHQFEDTGAVIAAPTTSIPEAQGTGRNWDYRYCWLRDAYFTVEALNRLGQFEEMEGFVSYVHNIVETSGTHRLQPVYGITGEAQLTEKILGHLDGYRGHQPVRIGNQAYEHLQHDIYGETIMAISPLFLDARFGTSHRLMPRSLLTRLLKAIETHLHDPDAGLWEYRGLAQVHTFSMLMHWAGAKHALEIGKTWGFQEIVPLAERLMEEAGTFLKTRCFHPEVEAFTQAPGSRELDAALLMMVPLGFLDIGDERALAHLATVRRQLGTPKGLLKRYAHADDFGATDNAFTVCSFWWVEAAARLGQRAAADELFEQLLACANPLGLYSEDLEPNTLELWGNFPQTYSHVGLINAAFALSEG